MATNVLLPQWGMNMEDGLLVKWLVKEGDAVEAGQPLVEVETAKIESELESPVSGVVAHVMVPEGTTVDVGTIVAVVAEPGEDVPRPSTASPPRGPKVERRKAPATAALGQRGRGVQVTPVARRLAGQHDIDLDRVQGTGPNGRITEEDVTRAVEAERSGERRPAVQVVPRARQLASQHGIELSQVQGTGPDGRVLVADVERAIATLVPGGVAEVIPIRGIRKTIADRMLHSAQSTAPVTLTTEADVTEAVRFKEVLLSRWREHRIRPLEIDLIVKATAEALKEHPRLNALVAKDEIRLLEEINIGVATAVPDGLMVPVIKRADEKDLLSIAREIREMADRARKSELSVDDVTGATFTITSLAGYQIDAFTPIIDSPQVAILGVGRVAEKPGMHRGEVAVRSMMFLSLTFDHRAVDGAPAGEFLRAVSQKLEAPDWMDSEHPER
jgi:pyruvate dehydrogenase E2 component (dihydrolipoamide acetyltransferase)